MSGYLELLEGMNGVGMDSLVVLAKNVTIFGRGTVSGNQVHVYIAARDKLNQEIIRSEPLYWHSDPCIYAPVSYCTIAYLYSTCELSPTHTHAYTYRYIHKLMRTYSPTVKDGRIFIVAYCLMSNVWSL
jgi:hypothetical protein